MSRAHNAIGTFSVSIITIPLLNALTEINYIKKWLTNDVIISYDDYYTNQSPRDKTKTFLIFILKKSDSSIIWKCKQQSLDITIDYQIEDKTIKITIFCLQFSIYTSIQDWIYRFYRLQNFVETGITEIQNLEYSNKIAKDISVSIPIKASNSEIYSCLTKNSYLRQIFSKYPECELEEFKYTWGWLEEGPSNLITWKRNSILIHDFIVDFTPIGYIKWEIEDKKTYQLLILTHKDISLDDEVDKLKAYNSYKFGWLYFLAKIKDIAEHSTLTIQFKDDILD